MLGAIGRFWRVTDDQLVKGIDGPKRFREFAQPRYAKAAISFRVVLEGSGCRIVTETRVKETSPQATRVFRVYSLVSGSRPWAAA